MPVKAQIPIVLLSAGMAVGGLACTSEQNPTGPPVGAPLVRAAARAYTPVDLGTLGGCCSAAHDISAAGGVVGESETADGLPHGFLWDQGIMIDLGTLGGCCSTARGINPARQVVGESHTKAGSIHAFLWRRGVMTDLGTLGGDYSGAFDINPAGQVVGESETEDGEIHAFLWEKGVMTDLGTLGGAGSRAFGINRAGQVVGQRQAADGSFRAFHWRKGAMADLGPDDARAINPRGQVVGLGFVGDEFHAFRWAKGVATDLGTLGGGFSWAFGINPAGSVVGESNTTAGDFRAFLWEKGVMTDLGTLGEGAWSSANSVNAAGHVVGWSEYLFNGFETHATLWTRD